MNEATEQLPPIDGGSIAAPSLLVEIIHPLVDKNALAAVGLISPLGIGIALMSPVIPHMNFLFWFGCFICSLGIGATIWLYWNQIFSWSKAGIVITALVALEILVPCSLIFYSVYENRASGQRHNDIVMAKRWVTLSNEIIADLATLHHDFNLVNDPALSEDARARLELREEQIASREYEVANDRMKQKYLGRVGQADEEMTHLGLKKKDDRLTADLSMVMVFGWEEWATKLAAEGNSLLNKLGEKDD